MGELKTCLDGYAGRGEYEPSALPPAAQAYLQHYRSMLSEIAQALQLQLKGQDVRASAVKSWLFVASVGAKTFDGRDVATVRKGLAYIARRTIRDGEPPFIDDRCDVGALVD